MLTDPRSDGLVELDTVHERIHAGHLFTASFYAAGVLNAANADMLVRPVEETHLRFDATSAGDAELLLYENPTISANGTALTLANRNRASKNVATTTAYSGPTVSAVGTKLFDTLVPAWTHSQIFEEWVLKAGNIYLVRFTNKSGATQDLGLLAHVYKPRNS